MKQFNLFPVARGIAAIIHRRYILHTHRQRSNTKYIKKIETNTYNGQGEHIFLIVDKLLHINLRIIHSGCNKKYINIVKEIE